MTKLDCMHAVKFELNSYNSELLMDRIPLYMQPTQLIALFPGHIHAGKRPGNEATVTQLHDETPGKCHVHLETSVGSHADLGKDARMMSF